VSDTRKTEASAFCANPVVQEKVTTINADLDAVAEKRHDSMSRHDRIVGLRELGVRFSNLPLELVLLLVVRACRLLITVGRPALIFWSNRTGLGELLRHTVDKRDLLPDLRTRTNTQRSIRSE